jgi:hypothetical protein
MVGALTNVSDDRRRAPAGRKIALHRYRSGRHAIDCVYQRQCGTLLLNSLLVAATMRDGTMILSARPRAQPRGL